MTKLVGYSFVAAGITIPKDYLGSAFVGPLRSAVTLDFDTYLGADANYLSLKSFFPGAYRLWADKANVEFIEVPDSGHPLGTDDQMFGNNVTRCFCADFGYGDSTDVQDVARSTISEPRRATVFSHSAYASDVMRRRGVYFPALEVGHTAMNLPDSNRDDPTDIMTTGGDAVINDHNAGVAQYWYGPPKTLTEKLGEGQPLGEILSTYQASGYGTPGNGALLIWHQNIKSGAATIRHLASALTGGPSTAGSIRSIWGNGLGREPSATELSAWAWATNDYLVYVVATSWEASLYRARQFGSKLWFS